MPIPPSLRVWNSAAHYLSKSTSILTCLEQFDINLLHSFRTAHLTHTEQMSSAKLLAFL